MNVFDKTVQKGKKKWRYKTPYPIEDEIPTVRELMNNPNHMFIESFPGNAESLIWITRQKLDAGNFRSFLYAMVVYAISNYDPSDACSWQFRRNLRKLKTKIATRKIEISLEDECIIYFMENMDSLPQESREESLSEKRKSLEKETIMAALGSG